MLIDVLKNLYAETLKRSTEDFRHKNAVQTKTEENNVLYFVMLFIGFDAVE